MEEAQRKQAQLQEALDQLQAKVHQGEGREGHSERRRERVNTLGWIYCPHPKMQPEKYTVPLLVPILCLPAEASGHEETQSSPKAVAAATGGSIPLGKYLYHYAIAWTKSSAWKTFISFLSVWHYSTYGYQHGLES